VDAIIAIISGIGKNKKVQDLEDKIVGMFQDTQGNKSKTLTLTSIHKSKGREWDRVFWYGRNRWNPSSYARQDWQMEQEKNLMYVAGTRAKTTLVDIVVPIPKKKGY
jgi:superfamily I DNA/RNA helicase